MVTAAIAFSCFLAVVTESSEGVKQIQDWPSLMDWFGNFLALVIAAMVSGFPGYATSFLLPQDEIVRTIAIAASVVVSFPVVVLSQLDVGSMWGVLSPRILQSMLRCPISWFTFLVQSALIAAACIAATIYAAEAGWHPLLVAAPLGTTALFLYARLLGRLGWRLAETMPEPT
jgi:hypothetical protein